MISNVVKDEFKIESFNVSSLKFLIYIGDNSNNETIKLFGNSSLQLKYSKIEFKTNINENNIKNINDNLSSISTNTTNISDNLGKIGTNTSNISDNLGKIGTNTPNISDNLGKIDTNTSSISDNSGLISTNTSNISSNLKKINDNKDDITALQTSNIKAFYNLDKIFIYDIEKGYKTVDKDNHFHIFEKEITYNFTKNSYLEIALKVLTEVFDYTLIGFFQILCNFCDQDNNLFYTISLSTAMGSINKLSTIKSVFIVPINENMSKIKIDFFIAPKETQQHRSAKFSIQDINSNKIYVKYFQKTDEMSIKDIQDSLNDLKQINDSIKLENIKNILFYDQRDQINFKGIFFDRTYELNI